MLMARLAEQARWGRLSGRKMAMVHDVPGLGSNGTPGTTSFGTSYGPAFNRPGRT
jgi:hypothetical protein